MTYTYYCNSCKQDFEKKLLMEDRDKPIKQKCPHCGKKGLIDRVFQPMGIAYEGAMSDIKRAGGDWGNLLTKMSKNVGKRSTIQTQ